MTSASVPALPVDVWSHVAQFLPVRDRVALLDASVSTREAVLRATRRRISDFLDGREHFFHHPGGAPCVDVEANASFARGLLRHAEYVLPCADAEAVLLAAMSSAFADSFDDVRLADAASQRESERTDCVARFMVMASKDMSDRMKGKMVGIFLQLDIDLLEKEDAGAISVESRRQDFDADFEYEDEQKVERSNAARLLFRAKMRIFVIIHVVLGCETLAHLRSDYDPDADLQSHFKWQSFTTSFLGLLSTRRSTSVGLLRTLTMPNLRWYALRVTRVLAKRRKDDKGECATSASIMVKIFGLKSIDEEMDAYEQNDIKAFTNIQALESVDDFNFNLGEVYSPAEVFNINIVALSKFLVLILRDQFGRNFVHGRRVLSHERLGPNVQVDTAWISLGNVSRNGIRFEGFHGDAFGPGTHRRRERATHQARSRLVPRRVGGSHWENAPFVVRTKTPRETDADDVRGDVRARVERLE